LHIFKHDVRLQVVGKGKRKILSENNALFVSFPLIRVINVYITMFHYY